MRYIYVNGVLFSSGSSNTFTGTGGNTQVGALTFGTHLLLGWLDDLVIYNYALSASAIAGIYQGYGYAYGVGSVCYIGYLAETDL